MGPSAPTSGAANSRDARISLVAALPRAADRRRGQRTAESLVSHQGVVLCDPLGDRGSLFPIPLGDLAVTGASAILGVVK
jgi:hypothetical protein